MGSRSLWRSTSGTTVHDIVLSVPRLPPLSAQPWPPRPELLQSSTPARFASNGLDLGTLPCFKHWSAAHLISHGENVSIPVWKQPTSEFVLARGREAEFERSLRITHSNETLRTFWAAAGADGSDHSPDEFWYHSGPVASWPASLRSDLEGIESVLAIDDAPSDVRRWPPSSANVWMGHRNVLATAHYDTSHNFVVQVFGHKTWRLWPPSELPNLRLHPSTHPSRRQTRIQLVANGTLHGAYFRTRALQEVLAPGEILYVPPYWSHAVLSTDAGLSISVLSPSWLEVLHAALRAHVRALLCSW